MKRTHWGNLQDAVILIVLVLGALTPFISRENNQPEGFLCVAVIILLLRVRDIEDRS